MDKYSFYDIFDKVQKLEDPLKADALFDAVRDAYGLQHALYVSVTAPFPTRPNCHIQGTYPDEWLQHYFANDYILHDPVALHGFTEIKPFDWGDLSKDNKIAKQIFDESLEFGFGKQGSTIPIASFDNETAIFNINSEDSDKDWATRKPHLIRDLQIIAQFFHNSVVGKNPVQTSAPQYDLTEKELECLKWAASGKSVWETSVIVNATERGVRFHLDQARRKMNCTTKIQAVAKAVATGMINIS